MTETRLENLASFHPSFTSITVTVAPRRVFSQNCYRTLTAMTMNSANFMQLTFFTHRESLADRKNFIKHFADTERHQENWWIVQKISDINVLCKSFVMLQHAMQCENVHLSLSWLLAASLIIVSTVISHHLLSSTRLEVYILRTWVAGRSTTDRCSYKQWRPCEHRNVGCHWDRRWWSSECWYHCMEECRCLSSQSAYETLSAPHDQTAADFSLCQLRVH